jgi:hypothetical protein
MNNRVTYQSLVDRYKEGNRVIRKLGIYGLFIQIGAISVINAWKHLEMSYYHIAVPILFVLSIYYLVKDFFVLLRIEENMARMVLEGVDLEIKNVTFGNFFHRILQSFNFTSILVQRSLVNVLALAWIGYLMLQFIREMYPGVTISQWYLSLFIWVPCVIASKLYYDSLKDLDEAKSRVFAK